MASAALEKIVISGDPYSRGTQYGIKAKKKIDRALDVYREMFAALNGVSWDRALEFSRTFIPRVREYDETFMEEMEGIATGSGHTVEDIIVINCRTEIIFGLKQAEEEGCTAFCALPEVCADRGVILAQNWDFKPWAAGHALLLQVNQPDAPDIITFVEAGQLARMGMNSAGIGICNNFIQCEDDGNGMDTGIPTTFIRRKALSSDKYYDVLGTIIHSSRSFSGNYLVATAELDGDAVDIEAMPNTVFFIYPEDGLVVHSNHIKGGGPGYCGVLREGIENSIYRDRRVEGFLRKRAGGVSVETAKEALRDHMGYPRSVCRHPDEKKAYKDQWRTNASLIMDLKHNELWVANGPPCETEYVRYDFSYRG